MEHLDLSLLSGSVMHGLTYFPFMFQKKKTVQMEVRINCALQSTVLYKITVFHVYSDATNSMDCRHNIDQLQMQLYIYWI